MMTAILLASLNVQCPNWLPGTNEVLPPGVTLSPAQETQNIFRCYCEVVKPAVKKCIRRKPYSECIELESDWLSRETAKLFAKFRAITPVPSRPRIMSIEP